MADNNHPITPPPELVEQWCYEDGDEIRTSPRWYQRVCAKAARWGADQELEACCEWMTNHFHGMKGWAGELRDARRPKAKPKPPSLKEQALKALDEMKAFYGLTVETGIIRRALEALPE